MTNLILVHYAEKLTGCDSGTCGPDKRVNVINFGGITRDKKKHELPI